MRYTDLHGNELTECDWVRITDKMIGLSPGDIIKIESFGYTVYPYIIYENNKIAYTMYVERIDMPDPIKFREVIPL